MSVLENFKNIPRSPYGGGRQGSNVFFFFKFATKSLEEKKGALSPVGGGDRVLLSASRHSFCHLSLKIQEKSWSDCRVVTSF